MSTIETTDVAALAAQLKAKAAEVGAATDELARLRGELDETAVAGGDTRAVRDRIAETQDGIEDREAQRSHLSKLLDRARQAGRRRAAFAALAEVYDAQAADLRLVVEVNAAREAMEAAQARRGSQEAGSVQQRRVHAALLGRSPASTEAPPAELTVEQLPFVSTADWQDQAQVRGQVERFERLSAEAREAAA